MYIGIFAGIIFGFILPNSGKTEDEYKSMKCKFAWFDYDQQKKIHKKVSLYSFATVFLLYTTEYQKLEIYKNNKT